MIAIKLVSLLCLEVNETHKFQKNSLSRLLAKHMKVRYNASWLLLTHQHTTIIEDSLSTIINQCCTFWLNSKKLKQILHSTLKTWEMAKAAGKCKLKHQYLIFHKHQYATDCRINVYNWQHWQVRGLLIN